MGRVRVGVERFGKQGLGPGRQAGLAVSVQAVPHRQTQVVGGAQGLRHS